ncbi:hypothetical protein FPRO05_13130 [Fusarium proliferatum]|uniref:Uncharacterized protein n=1 Tax=Gibberella intermedia TaxID=948311 RepID=A0A365N290_GIBIN|nr:hypothetical protein FPRO05_13130 [Fusarium proliferatum]
MGFITCAAGITAWKVDNIHCGDLVRWRHEVGLPWGILLEGHGWWYAPDDWTGCELLHHLGDLAQTLLKRLARSVHIALAT